MPKKAWPILRVCGIKKKKQKAKEEIYKGLKKEGHGSTDRRQEIQMVFVIQSEEEPFHYRPKHRTCR